MFRNYVKTAWRNITKHRAYSVINVAGLTLGIASCLVIFLVVQYELGYDKFNKKYDRIYRVTLHALDFNPFVSLGIVPAMRNDFPELEKVTQVLYRREGVVKVGQTKYDEKGFIYADSNFASVFDYDWMAGDPRIALKDPNEVVLTESIAHKYFGNENPVGKSIELGTKSPYILKVTGLIRDVPGNSHLPFRFMISWETVRKDFEKDGAMNAFYWINDGAMAYLVLPKNMNVGQLQAKMHGFIGKNWGQDLASSASLPLQPLADIHFDPRYLNNTITYTTSRETYYILSAVALLIILIACINFINLATAQAIARAREVGVRKVLGSGRSQLIRQFLGETAFMVFIALVLAILLILLCLPQLAAWLDLKISVAALANPQMVASVLVATFLVILIAGLYPAFIQSGFRPIESLKSKPVTTKGSLGLRKTLVVVQFAISQAMIVGTLVVAYQMDFFQNRNLGYDKELVISMRTPDFEKSAVFKQELESTPGVSQTSFSSGSPANASQFCPFIAPQFGVTQDDVTELRFMDENFIPMFDIQLLAGNPIVKNAKTWKDSVYDIVVNEALIHKLGIMDPHRAIGQPITVNGNWSCTINGVVADFQSESKHKKIRPCVMLYRSDAFGTVCVRLAPGNLKNTIASIDKSWSTLSPAGLFTFEFMDDHIAEWYRQENKEYVAFRLFAGIAILIGCLGLYGLISFAVAQRTKEIGIRKVLGASVTNIVYLFSRNFIWLIGLAFLIAAPLAYFVMHNWLRGFAYQINIGPNIFLISLGVSGVIAALTISYQTIKAGISNPVKSLRTE